MQSVDHAWSEEEAPRESESKYRVLFDAAGVAFFLLRAEGGELRVLDMNQQALSLLGATRDELIGSVVPDPSTPVQPDGRSAHDVAADRVARALQGETQTFEWRHRRMDGTPVDTDVTLARMPLASGPHLFAIVRDSSARRRAEQELRENERKYYALYQEFRGILDAIPDSVALISPDLRIVWANEMAAENMRLSLPDFLRQHCYQSRHGRSQPCEICPVRACFASGQPQCGETTTPDQRVWELHAAPIFDELGQVKGVIEVSRDVTMRKHAEREREHLEAQLRHAQKMEAIGQLAGGVAHDFNNILTAIFGNVELAVADLRAQVPAAQGALDSLQQIERSAQRAAELTRHLLAFSRRQVTRPEVLDLNRTLRELEKMLRRMITEDIDLELALGASPATIEVDPGQLEQVVVNLAINACDAMAAGGRLVLQTFNEVLDEAYVVSRAEARPGEHVVLVVADTGCGMDESTIERIFEPFFTTKPHGHGTGLGLSTVYGIVKQAGGHIVVHSAIGQGTSFKLYLPGARKPTAAERPVHEEPAPPAGSEILILCEDDRAVRELAGQVLRDAGYTVLLAGDAGQALHLAAEHAGPIDLLVTDVIMPDMNGRKLSDALTALRPELRTLFISGYTSNVLARHGVLEQDVEFLQKPFSRRTLLVRVREALGRTATAVPAPQ